MWLSWQENRFVTKSDKVSLFENKWEFIEQFGLILLYFMPFCVVVIVSIRASGFSAWYSLSLDDDEHKRDIN